MRPDGRPSRRRDGPDVDRERLLVVQDLEDRASARQHQTYPTRRRPDRRSPAIGGRSRRQVGRRTTAWSFNPPPGEEIRRMKIAFIGYGQVGAPLADALQRAGNDVFLAARNPDSGNVKQASARNENLRVASPGEAVAASEIVFLATPPGANESAIKAVIKELQGKILIDCTNPIGPDLSHGLRSETSGAEMIQRLVPETEVIKAFNIYGYENFENNIYPGYEVKPAMLYCGRDAEAKQIFSGLLGQLGWDPLDVGGLEQSLHLEHMALLWVRMVRAGARSPNIVWAALTR
ncbi:MAG: hypothetical protein GF355_15890 [Candidatus Eisenbacteria bacterium]|nr:hypothetical protein [Candidatus Eisenbacteria bacterium]